LPLPGSNRPGGLSSSCWTNGLPLLSSSQRLEMGWSPGYRPWS
jgi:hypothetical protein